MTIPRVGFVSLGCPKNLVDSERILSQLRAEGYRISPMLALIPSLQAPPRCVA